MLAHYHCAITADRRTKGDRGKLRVINPMTHGRRFADEDWYPGGDSNPQWTGSEPAAFASYATRACVSKKLVSPVRVELTYPRRGTGSQPVAYAVPPR